MWLLQGFVMGLGFGLGVTLMNYFLALFAGIILKKKGVN